MLSIMSIRADINLVFFRCTMSSSRSSLHSADLICYICGSTLPKAGKTWNQIFTKFAQVSELYIGMKVGNQDKSWTPRVVCDAWWTNLEGWLRNDCYSVPFDISRIVTEPQHHVNGCYLCMVDIFKTKNQHDSTYPDILSSTGSVEQQNYLFWDHLLKS